MVMLEPVDIAHAALMEAGRPDLAAEIIWYLESDTPGDGYIEFNFDILSDDDWALIDKAESLARQAYGLPPIERSQA